MMHTSKPRELTRSHGPVTRRALIRSTASLASGAALAGLLGMRWAPGAAAQDDSVILIAGAAEIGATPGSAFARSAAAEAVADRGTARVQAAAALAAADSDEGAVAQSPVAFAAAEPDAGAVAQGAIAAASASSQDDDNDRSGVPAPTKAIAPAPAAGRGGRQRGGGRMADGGDGGARVRGGGRAMRVGRGGGGRRGRGAQVGSLPDAGIGSVESGQMVSLFAAASALTAFGAFVVRKQGETALAGQRIGPEE